jgi:hypothetical protein
MVKKSRERKKRTPRTKRGKVATTTKKMATETTVKVKRWRK